MGGIQKLLAKAEALSLDASQLEQLDDGRLAGLLYPGGDLRACGQFERPDWSAVHPELKHPHVTWQLVWEEYTQRFPGRRY